LNSAVLQRSCAASRRPTSVRNARFIAARVFYKLLATHAVVHIHPNNCCGAVKSAGLEIPRIAEFTLLRRDRLRSTSYRTTLPHPLDRPNVRKAPLNLAPCWYT
jgi:hypothetical protein